MGFVGGVVWWIVLGAFVGWVAAWIVGRSSQRLLTEPVLQIVERRVDNPQHVARIATLEREVAALADEAAAAPALRARLEELLAAPPRVVEKVVTRTVDRVVEKPVERIVEKIVERPVDRVVEKIVERPVERVVERLVDRPVPDLAAIAEREAALRAQRLRIEHLDALAAVLADRVADARRAAPAAPSVAPAVPDAAAAPGEDPMRPLRARVEHLEALARVQAERLAEPRASAAGAGAATPAPDDADIERVEGIGPTIAELLRARGLGSFGALAQASPGTLREILDGQGPAYRIADPSTWPEQARLAADGRWDELKALQDALHAGRR